MIFPSLHFILQADDATLRDETSDYIIVLSEASFTPWYRRFGWPGACLAKTVERNLMQKETPAWASRHKQNPRPTSGFCHRPQLLLLLVSRHPSMILDLLPTTNDNSMQCNAAIECFFMDRSQHMTDV